MIRMECPICGHENLVSDYDEEPICELCDGSLERFEDDDQDDEEVEPELPS